MKNRTSKGFASTCIHGNLHPDLNQSHLTPIYASSTYTFSDSAQAVERFTNEQPGYIYGRFGHPTGTEVEEKIAAMEAYGLLDDRQESLKLKAILHGSGMGAVSTLFLANLKQGEKLLTHLSLYGGTQEFIDKVLPSCGIETILMDFSDPQAIVHTLQSDSGIRMVYLETPANPTLQCVDIERITTLAHQYGCLVAVDNTFATPYLQQPFRWGVDFVLHSTTKFLNGHGTAIGGILLGRNIEWMQTKATKHFRLLGAAVSAFDAFLLNNGLKTLPLRMQQHGRNAEQVAGFLEAHPAVERVNYLGLKSHPHFALAQKQMKHPGALLSFEIKGGMQAAMHCMDALQLCTRAVSLGTVDTLVSHPATTTHVGVDPILRRQSGITDGLIRMSVGIEDIEDILNDLQVALEASQRMR